MKKVVIVLMSLFLAVQVSAGVSDSIPERVFEPRINVKMNGLALIGVVNPAVELRMSDRWSVQLEAMGVFAKENFLGTGYPFELTAMFGEGRYYFKNVFKSFFVGMNVGTGTFRLNKNVLHKFFGWAPDLDYKKHENAVHVGSNLMAGITLGYIYRFKRNPHWSLELNWSLGRQWARYEEYIKLDGESIKHKPMNGSAEYMPFYRGGLYIAYSW